MANIPNVYYVVTDHGKLGRETVIDWERCSRANIIHDLVEGQYDTPVEVHCIDRNENRWVDISEDIADEVLDLLDERPRAGLLDFLEDCLGESAVIEKFGYLP